MTHTPATVYLVDDDDSVRRALSRVILSGGYRVEAFASARAFLDAGLHATAPACLVLDVQLPGLSGFDLQQELNAARVNLPIVFITGHGDIPMSVSAMKAGAADFLPKPVEDTALLDAIARAVSRSASHQAEYEALAALRARVERLTPRERQVLALVVQGRLNKQIASELGTVEKTVKVHRARVMEKMEVDSLAELVRLAAKAGIPDGDLAT